MLRIIKHRGIALVSKLYKYMIFLHRTQVYISVTAWLNPFRLKGAARF